jgi:hypothetical protein
LVSDIKGIFEPKRDEVVGDWRKLHNDELHNLCCSPSTIGIIKSRRVRWAGHAARMGEKRTAYRILVGKAEGKRPLGRPRRRWEDNIKMDLREKCTSASYCVKDNPLFIIFSVYTIR